MYRVTRILAIAAVAFFVCRPASAGLIGTSVTGSIMFDGNSTNYFDPAFGYVPPGYLNTAGTTVTIAEPAIEYGFLDGANQDTANFTASQLIVTDTVFSGASNWTMTFTDTAFTGASFSKVSDTFTNGGVTGILVGDTITLTWAGTNSADGLLTATFDVATSAVPEPSSIVLALTAVPLALGYLRCRRAVS